MKRAIRNWWRSLIGNKWVIMKQEWPSPEDKAKPYMTANKHTGFVWHTDLTHDEALVACQKLNEYWRK